MSLINIFVNRRPSYLRYKSEEDFYETLFQIFDYAYKQGQEDLMKRMKLECASDLCYTLLDIDLEEVTKKRLLAIKKNFYDNIECEQ